MNRGGGALKTRLTQISKAGAATTQLARATGSVFAKSLVQNVTEKFQRSDVKKSTVIGPIKSAKSVVNFQQVNFNIPAPYVNLHKIFLIFF